ncbi:ATP-binding protein [Brevibacterium sp. BDJS002]|uniref:ATP-binding protein n=1 Tax=Brevibacterium sp. BDJS002 TaxID=3020906 RepID=UPI002307A476|nr:ATP-binding protein [Brevibacterium sp. BDJS002]MDN5737205.1 ATP-binding protein [Brevibacterium aurantiacum]MDN5772320.1 ATP-binding protein [Brevibacterium aurantiacum]WCE39918.1 ATP-binding protein [Brevibacterium sp. BDJS002]
MTNFLVFEIQIWLLLLLLFLVLAGLAVGAFFAWRYLRRREAALKESIETAASEDSLAKRNRMLIRLDHELKNPLTALRTSAASIRDVVREGGSITEVESSAKQVDISSRRVARLLADLRKLADVETRIIEYSRVDLDRLIHQAVEDASTAPGAEDRMIVATVARAPWRLPDVAGEEDLLLTAILNLLGNALKYSSQAEVVELRANEQIIDSHRWVVVEVADTGSGIPLTEQEQVWDELSRGSRVRAVAGSGMGLSLVRAIVTRHGGSVQLFSQEGVGTSVRMVLPVLGDAAQVTVPPMADQVGHAAAGSHPVQPVQLPDSGQTPGFLPPRQPNEAELQGRILGTPRRTSKRRLERVDGNLVHRSTGESLSGGFPPDSGQHSQFKPGPGVGRSPGNPQAAPQSGPQPGPQSGPVQGAGSPQSGPQQAYGSQPGPQRAYGSQPGPQQAYGSQPGPQQAWQQQPPQPQQPPAQPPQTQQPDSGQQPRSRRELRSREER